MDRILEPLNDKQREAVLFTDGPLLVLAGAGSGKTRVITHRFAYLLREKRLQLSNILAVTFTNKAAGEMKERITRLTGLDTSTAWVRTFHSMGVLILRKHAEEIGYPRDFVIYDDTDSRGLVKSIMKESGINTDVYNPGSIAEKISRIKESLQSPENFVKQIESEMDEKVALIYQSYEKALRRNRAFDFSDLITIPIYIFKKNNKVLSYYQSLWQYVMVDEFQDTNKAQYEMIKLIGSVHKNICVVGDDDQSIYGWRGANYDHIYDFRDRYNAKVILLEQNYRSSRVILEVAHAVVEKIPGRMDKKLWTQESSGEKVFLINALTDKEEANYVVSRIDSLLEEYDYKDFAIFYRTNAQSRLFEEELLVRNIPYRIFGGQKFYARKEIKDILAYIKLIIDPFDSASFERIINVPKRKIGEVALEKLKKVASDGKTSFIDILLNVEKNPSLSRLPFEALKELGRILEELREEKEKLTPMSFVKILIDAIGYKSYITSFDEDGLDRWSNVEELINSIKEYEDDNPGALITDYVNDITLQSSADEIEADDSRNYVSLMTLHNAKGLEFPVVFICGLVDGLLPHASSLYSARDIEEERRLFYVGITRAMKILHLSYSESRMKYGELLYQNPSPFLNDIPEEFVEEVDLFKEKKDIFGWQSKIRKKEEEDIDDIEGNGELKIVEDISDIKVGDKVYHHLFGKGKVAAITKNFVTIVFKDYGKKVISGNFLSNIEVVSS